MIEARLEITELFEEIGSRQKAIAEQQELLEDCLTRLKVALTKIGLVEQRREVKPKPQIPVLTDEIRAMLREPDSLQLSEKGNEFVFKCLDAGMRPSAVADYVGISASAMTNKRRNWLQSRHPAQP